MKQSKVDRRRLYADFWHEVVRWACMILFIAGTLSTVICLHFRLPITFLMYFVEFLVSLFIAWVFMFRRRPVKSEFEGDD